MYYDQPNYQLLVTIMMAVDLPPRDTGQARNPYCKLYLLPDRKYVSCSGLSTIVHMLIA